MSTGNSSGSYGSAPQGGWVGKAIVVLIVWIVLAGVAYYIFRPKPVDQPPPAPVNGKTPKPDVAPTPSAAAIEIGVAYGTEKKSWLEWAVKEFAETDDGKQIKVQLIPMGSVEAGHAIAQNEGRVGDNKRIHVWSPASSLNCAVFRSEWELRHSGDPIAKEESLAMTPMVFVMWKSRQEALKSHFPEVTFQSISQAMDMEGGWGGIAQKPDWGLFKFDHTDPNKSNSGLATLVLMAYDFHGKTKNLTPADIVKPEFQTWLAQFARGVSARIESTGTLMQDMVRKGPSTYDAVMVYESVAIDYLRQAEGRWGPMCVVYPKRNIWSDHPYCILKTDWCKPEHQQAAEKFLSFLLSEPIQTKALDHGFRPGNLQVAINFPESPFIKYADHGLKIDLTTICDPPTGEVLNNLIQSWQRASGAH